MRGVLATILVLSGMVNAYCQNTDTFQVFFPRNDVQLTTQSKTYIDSLISGKLLLLGQHLKVLGYADYLGDARYNDSLSQCRAKNVLDYLLNSGYNSSHVALCVGKGKIDRAPSAANDGYATDRKVQIVIDRFAPPDTLTDTPENKLQEVVEMISTENLDLSMMAVNEELPLDHVSFGMGAANLIPSSYKELAGLVAYLKKNPSVCIQIEGHICCRPLKDTSSRDVGPESMSGRRAKSVYDFLVLYGVEKKRLRYVGLGASQPFVSPETKPEDESLNRRVGIKIIKK